MLLTMAETLHILAVLLLQLFRLQRKLVIQLLIMQLLQMVDLNARSSYS